MAMEITNNYSSVYESTYAAQKQQETKKEAALKAETKGTAVTQKNAGSTTGSSDYLNKLQKQIPSMILREGNYIPTSNDRRVGTLTIHPDILAQMQSDPEKEKYYTQRMKDIAAAEKLAKGISASLGHTRVYSHWYIDKDGKIWHTAMTIRKDELNEKLRKKAQENTKKHIEKIRENARKKREELAEKIEEKAENLIIEKIENSEDGRLFFDDEEVKTIIEAAKENNQEKTNLQKPMTQKIGFDVQI